MRRFVKPVTEVERDDDGQAGRPCPATRSPRSGPARLPVLAAAVGYIVASVTARQDLGSHILFIGEVGEVGGEPADVLRMEDTRMHYGG